MFPGYSGTSGCTISGNKALALISGGGGVYLADSNDYTSSAPDTSLSVQSGSIISLNSAVLDGGGIFTEDYADYANLTMSDYQNLSIDASNIFRGNTAAASYTPPAIAASYTNIAYAETSIRENGGYVHPFNNYDINYVGTEPAQAPVAMDCTDYCEPRFTGSAMGQETQGWTVSCRIPLKQAMYNKPERKKSVNGVRFIIMDDWPASGKMNTGYSPLRSVPAASAKHSNHQDDSPPPFHLLF